MQGRLVVRGEMLKCLASFTEVSSVFLSLRYFLPQINSSVAIQDTMIAVEYNVEDHKIWCQGKQGLKPDSSDDEP